MQHTALVKRITCAIAQAIHDDGICNPQNFTDYPDPRRHHGISYRLVRGDLVAGQGLDSFPKYVCVVQVALERYGQLVFPGVDVELLEVLRGNKAG